MIINKKKKWTDCIVNFVIWLSHRVKIKDNKKRDRYLDFAREPLKLRNMKLMSVPIVISVFGTVPKGLVRGTGRVGNWRTNWDHPNNGIAKTGQNTEKSPEERRITVTQTQVKVYQFALMRGACKKYNNNNNNNNEAKDKETNNSAQSLTPMRWDYIDWL